MAREMFLLAVIVGGMFWLGYRFRVLPRRDSFRGQTEALAFTPQVGDPLRPARPPVHAVPLGGVGAADREHRHRLARRQRDRDRRLLVRADRGPAVRRLRAIHVRDRAVDGGLVGPDRGTRTARVAAARRDRRSADQHGAGGVQPRVPDPRNRRAVRERVRGCADDGVAAAAGAGRRLRGRRRTRDGLPPPGDGQSRRRPDSLALYDAFVGRIPKVVATGSV